MAVSTFCSLFPQTFNTNTNTNTNTNQMKMKMKMKMKITTRCAVAPAAPTTKKKRIWKEGEFPGFTTAPDSLSTGTRTRTRRRSPIKNIKKTADKKAKAKAWVNTVTESLSLLIDQKAPIQALEVFQMLRSQPFYRPSEPTYLKLLVLLSRCSLPHLARQLFDEMLTEGLPPSPPLYTALLSAYARSSLLPEALAVLDQMKSLPASQPDVFTYSILIKACVDSLRFDLIPGLYDEMSLRGISPNTVTQNTVLQGFGRAGLFDRMEAILSNMLVGSNPACRPDVWTMNIFLSVFGYQGHIQLMEKWYEKFRDFGIEPETRTFNILIGAYGKNRMYDKMSSVMEYMRKLNFPWTTATYNNVIEAFADVGDVKHMECTFDQMRSERMKPDSKTFCCLVQGYAKAGSYHKVIGAVELAARLNVPQDTRFYNAVIDACAKADDLMEMERVFNRMKDAAQCPPDSTTFQLMVEAYGKVGMNDKVFHLEQEMMMAASTVAPAAAVFVLDSD